MKTLLSIFSTFIIFVNSASIDSYPCSLALESVRYVSYLDLLCTEYFFEGVNFLPGTQHIIFNNLQVQIDVEHNNLIYPVHLSNDACSEWGNIGYITDDRDIQDHKPSIYLCGKANLNHTKSDIRIQGHSTQHLRGILYTKKKDDRPIQCPITNKTMINVEMYKEMTSDICSENNCTITCASLTLGAGREYVLPGQRLDLVQETTFNHALGITDMKLLHITKSGIICVEMKLQFSADVARFYLHDDTDIRLSNIQWTKPPIKFNNDECVSTLSNYNTEAYHTIWKEPAYLCTSGRVPSISRKMTVAGNITFITTTKSGHRVKDSTRITHKFYRVQETISKLKNQCNIGSFRKDCRDCWSSCRASIKGHGYIYCKNSWAYKESDNGVSPIFVPFVSDQINVTQYNSTRNEDTHFGVLIRNVHWVLVGLVGLILIMACSIEMYLGCQCCSPCLLP